MYAIIVIYQIAINIMNDTIKIILALAISTLLVVVAISGVARRDSRLNDLCYDTVSQTAYQPESDGTCPR